MTTRALILGCAGRTLSAEETAFFRDVRPWGFILFKRNIGTPDEVRALTEALRETIGRADAPVLIDQEGGRVQRMGPPHWPSYPPGRTFGRLDGSAATVARLGARLMDKRNDALASVLGAGLLQDIRPADWDDGPLRQRGIEPRSASDFLREAALRAT